MRSIIRGQYEVLHEIGSGGMGKVYHARDLKLNRPVAIKVLLADHGKDPDRRRRFFLEAQAASALNHPNIITIYDVVSEEESDAIVMEFVAGQTLVDAIPRGGLRVPQVINYAVQISDALSAAHSAGIIHRDLKPANIMLTDKGRVKILDFGLAKLTELPSADPEATSATPLTVEGSIIGTFCYMSPEQAQGKKIDARSDIFAFGAVLYEMATGRRAFTGENSVTMLSSVLRDEPPKMIEVAPDVPPALDRIIYRCLRKDPDERWQSMEEVHQSLHELKHISDSGLLYRSRAAWSEDDATTGPIAVRPAPAPPTVPPAPLPLPIAPVSAPPPAASSGSKWAVWLGLIVFLSVAGAGFWYWKFPPRTLPEAIPSPPPASDASKPSPTGLSNASIIEMVKARVPESVVISQIRSTPGQFDLSAAEVIRMTQNGVSARIIEVMRNPKQSSGAPPATAPSAPETAGAPPVPPPAADASKGGAVIALADATPVALELTENAAANLEPGAVLRFSVIQDVSVAGTALIPKGSPATGVVLDRTKKKFLGFGSKALFEFTTVRAANGAPVKIRAIAKPRDDGDASRALESPGSKPKDVVAVKGTQFIAYIDGNQTVNIQK